VSGSAQSGSPTTSLVLGDIDGDGELEVVTTSYTGKDSDGNGKSGSLSLFWPLLMMLMYATRKRGGLHG
jgi:hypothetical protein